MAAVRPIGAVLAAVVTVEGCEPLEPLRRPRTDLRGEAGLAHRLLMARGAEESGSAADSPPGRPRRPGKAPEPL